MDCPNCDKKLPESEVCPCGHNENVPLYDCPCASCKREAEEWDKLNEQLLREKRLSRTFDIFGL